MQVSNDGQHIDFEHRKGEPMDDLISRQDAIDAVEARIKWFNGDAIEDRCKCDAFIQVIDEILTELPSADLKKMVGCTGCIHYDQQQTALICHDCKRYHKDMYKEW